MSMQHSSSSCHCRSSKKEASLSCHCGEKCVLRTAKTPKNRGRQFWGCPKYKVGSESVGCNYFRWLADCGHDDSVSCELFKANDQRLVKSDNNIVGGKVEENSVAVQKALMGVQRWTKILVHVVSFLCVMNIIVIVMLLGRT